MVTDSRRVQQYYRERYRATSTYIAYGAEPVRTPPGSHLRRYGLEPGRYVLFVGRLVPENCAHHLTEAWKDLATDLRLRDRRRRALRGGVHSLAEGHPRTPA